jgi:dimethylargininase
MLTRPGAPSRRPEVERIRACLPSWVTIVDQTTGTLDGGDVLRVGSTLFVGRSDRTDDSGIAALAAAFPEMNVVPVLVPGALHLKCHATALDADHVLVAEGFLPAQAFRGIAQPVWVPPDEAYAANVVVVGGSALVAAGYPKTRARVEAHGLRAIPLSMRAFSAADGSLTCLSVILDSGLERSGA